MALGRHLSLRGLCVLLLGTMVGGQALEVRLKDGDHCCEGRVEVKHQGEWGTVDDLNWSMEEAAVVCRQLGCGSATDAPKRAHFGPGIGPIWFPYIYCKGPESAIMECSYPPVKDHRPEGNSHDKDVGAVCSGKPCGLGGIPSRKIEVHSGEEWTPVSDGNFALSTAHVICAELGVTAGSVLGHVPFRESDGRVWAEEFRCKGEEPKLQFCPRVPCPGATCHHSGAVQVVCSAYSEVQLMTNGTSQCEGQVKMNTSGRWRALCASHWSLANANVVCHQLGCGVAISTPRGPHFVEGSDQISTVRFHCLGAESFLWSCPVTVLGGPDCSHDNTASVICSGKREGRATGGCSWSEISPRVESEGKLDLEDAHVVCRQLGCGEALNATGSAHFGAGSGPIWLDDLNCTGNESHVWRCPSRGWGRHDCRHKEDVGVICSEFLALRMVSEDQQCAGWLEVFYNGTWGSVCHSPMEDITVSMICRQLGCGESGILNSSVALREGSRPQCVDGIQCQKTDTSLWLCPSDPWNYTSCSPKEVVSRHQSCPTAAPCTGTSAPPPPLWLPGTPSSHKGQSQEGLLSGTRLRWCVSSWAVARPWKPCRPQGLALEMGTSGWTRCRGQESSLWDCAVEPWGQSDCKHEEDAGVRCSGEITLPAPQLPPRTRTTSNPLPGAFSLPEVLCFILGALLFLVLIILVTQLFRWRAERRALSSYEDALAEAVYKDLDHLVTQKGDLLGSPDQRTDALGEDYDDAEEVPLPGAPTASQGSEEEVPPEKVDVTRSSQTGSSLNISREVADPREEEESPWLLQGEEADTGYDDVELSALETSIVTSP
uniref:SRCR domain-containing protein n=1 Tax=Bos mutus grunniens TaxID=30521 RepID=A0A8B9Y075_BOSMU